MSAVPQIDYSSDTFAEELAKTKLWAGGKDIHVYVNYEKVPLYLKISEIETETANGRLELFFQSEVARITKALSQMGATGKQIGKPHKDGNRRKRRTERVGIKGSNFTSPKKRRR